MVMQKNKKGQIYNILFNFIFFIFLAIVILFIGYVLFTIGNDYIAVPVDNMKSVANYSQNVTVAIGTITNQYHNTNLVFFDYGFLLAILIVFLSGLFFSYKSRQMNYFNWLSGLLYVNMILLFILGIVLVYTNWLLALIIKVMPELNIQLPITYYIIENMGTIFLIISSIYFLINVVDFDFMKLKNRKKKEQQAIDGEIL